MPLTSILNPPGHAPRLRLASSSPYRRELLSRLRIPFDVVAPEVNETPHPGEIPEQLSTRLALAKALAVAVPGTWTIGSDQVATLDGAPIGKPGNHEAARAQLLAASGRTMRFHTALALVDPDQGRQRVERIDTVVRFRNLTLAEIDAYLHAEQPYDCAGAAKCEGLGIALLDAIEGDDPTALIGLPLIRLSGWLREWGWNPLLGPSFGASSSASSNASSGASSGASSDASSGASPGASPGASSGASLASVTDEP
ncbi:MAG: septum formation protein Maf [Betaproteobacteria bacterium]|nr:septum formation protein Maf [Betaproteobacteria bacterium]